MPGDAAPDGVDAGNSTKSQTNYLLLGVTAGGRHAALIFTRRGDMLRPRVAARILFSARLHPSGN